MAYPSFREVLLQLDPARPHVIELDCASYPDGTINTEGHVKSTAAGGFSFRDSAKPGSLERNRFIHWRTSKDNLDLCEESLDVNLLGKNLTIHFHNASLLPNVEIFETQTTIVVLAATTNSVHRFLFPHPNKLVKHEFSLSPRVTISTQSIFSDAVVPDIYKPWNFATFTQSCTSFSSWLCHDGYCMFSMVTNEGTPFIVKLPPVNSQDDVPYYHSDDSLNSPPSPTRLGYEKFYHLNQVERNEEIQHDHPPDKDVVLWKAYYTYMFDGRYYPQDHSLPSSITPTPTSPTSSSHPAMFYDNHWITQSTLFPFGFQDLDQHQKARNSDAKDDTSLGSKKLVQCVNCKKEFDNTASLEEHVKSTHKNTNRSYTCQYCSKSFSRSWNFQRHVLIHKGEKPHKCDKCPKAFVLAAHLKIHNRIHSGEKPYVCDICSRGFAQLTNLQRHVLTHTGQKPHKCTYCPKGFVSSSDLRRHVRIHTGERPYKCNNCPKAFTTSGNLHSHMLTHSGEKPFQCKICKWKFISSSNLRTHCRIHHKR